MQRACRAGKEKRKAHTPPGVSHSITLSVFDANHVGCVDVAGHTVGVMNHFRFRLRSRRFRTGKRKNRNETQQPFTQLVSHVTYLCTVGRWGSPPAMAASWTAAGRCGVVAVVSTFDLTVADGYGAASRIRFIQIFVALGGHDYQIKRLGRT